MRACSVNNSQESHYLTDTLPASRTMLDIMELAMVGAKLGYFSTTRLFLKGHL
ncbi:unnamed protein product [Photorhabdus laumondii subsp. laumondii TTO1]|uniref:Photorhabdus luminescens subsp. laumondii TTO1 complete genome segment 15/17 n=1 Tax=Photorhabdus laumondii subsp. laumondii (strain DSM 15139 / CIP 105565 / TT01) TaxID=243265 RepID=Q7MZF8_PHOLL|nr:unnamed protein product [Photorhabdus laumondii subsp. laumondii TTO1]